MSKKTKTSSELQGFTRLITDAVIGITDIVEDMHQRVVHTPFLPSTPIQNLVTNIAGITYNNIRWSTQLIGSGLDKALGRLTPLLGEIPTTQEREAIHSALNGVIGDYLEEKGNPLKISMQFKYNSKTLSLDGRSIADSDPPVNGKILLMVHGSCMNDLQWTRDKHNHGEALSKELDKTLIYLYYNSGRHISSNGKELNELLEELVLNWPVPVEELVIIAHSMGGLVTRSAIHYSEQRNNSWIQYLNKLVFLGTPHHGAPLEKIGNYLDVILEAIPYTKPFARLGKIRSAGVTDLRYGNLVDEDWQDNSRFEIAGDQRITIPLPKGVECYTIAAVIGKELGPLYSQIVGDSLVDIHSALGRHKNPDRNLDFKEANMMIAYSSTHLELLNNPEVYAKIKAWLK